jgi:uncharacterized protein (DUF983 family)
VFAFLLKTLPLPRPFINRVLYMKKEDLRKTTTEELQKRQKTTRLAVGVLIGMLGLLFVTGIIHTSLTKSFSFTLFMPIALLPIVISSLGSLKTIKEELKNRVQG